MESDLANKKTHVAEKALELKDKALKLKQELQNAHKIVNDSLDKMSVDGKRDQSNKDADSKPGSPSTKDGASKPPVTPKPLDEEDRQLTAEVMGDHSGAEERVGQREDEQQMDMDRLNKLRDIYAKTIEILDFN